jgi:hypothetical protein
MSEKIKEFMKEVLHPQTPAEKGLSASVALLVVLVLTWIIIAIVKATKKADFGAAPKRNELVFYHADFCGYCHQFMPIFDETASALLEMFPGLIITKLQHETDQLAILQAQPPVNGYPTVRLNGKEFEGPRTPEALMTFVRENYRSDFGTSCGGID